MRPSVVFALSLLLSTVVGEAWQGVVFAEPAISADTASISFSGVGVGQRRKIQFNLVNDTGQPVSSVGVAITGRNGASAPSSLTISATTLPQNWVRGATIPVNVIYAPTSTDLVEAGIELTIDETKGPLMGKNNASKLVEVTVKGWASVLGEEQQGTSYYDESFASISLTGDMLKWVDGALFSNGKKIVAPVTINADITSSLATVPTALSLNPLGSHTNAYRSAGGQGLTGIQDYAVTYPIQVPGQPAITLCTKSTASDGRALVIPGVWNGGRFSWPGPGDLFSLACLPEVVTPPNGFPASQHGGVVAKCVDWGFPPWNGAGNVSAPAAGLHTACVAMAMADYQGNGKSGTVDGTLIDVYGVQDARDHLETNGMIRATSPNNEHLAFEAAWAAQSSDRRCSAICLSKRRWQTMKGEKNNSKCLPDPRWNSFSPRDSGVGSKALRFCEQYTLDELTGFPNNAVLFNYSAFIDAGLYVCRANGTDLTTTQVDLDSPKNGEYRALAPAGSEVDRFQRSQPESFTCNAENDFIGTVFSTDAYRYNLLPAAVEKKDLLPLCRRGTYNNGLVTGFETDTGVLQVGMRRRCLKGDVPEGYIFGPKAKSKLLGDPLVLNGKQLGYLVKIR